MDVLVKAKDGFIHGGYNLNRNQEAVMDEHLARELSHLVEVLDTKAKPVHQNKMAGPSENKGNAGDDGQAKPSSASQVAQASAKTTAKPSDAGAKQGKTAK